MLAWLERVVGLPAFGAFVVCTIKNRHHQRKVATLVRGLFSYGEAPLPFDSNGNYSLPPGYLAVPGQTILATQHNPPLEDIAAAMSQVVLRSGVSPFSGNQSMAGFKITNAANGTADSDYVTMEQLNEVIASVGASAVPTGAVAGFRRANAPAGWIIENGGTIGNASSNATTRANADTEALFSLLWTDFPSLVIKTAGGVITTRGVSASADFAANKQLTIHDSRTRFHRGSDSGLDYDTSLIVGFSQLDALQNITGTFSSKRVNNVSSPEVVADWTGAFFDNGLGGSDFSMEVTGVSARRITGFDASRVVRTATETRPRASVVLYCIKL